MTRPIDVLRVARSQLGYHENRGPNDDTRYGRWYGDRVGSAAYDDAAWCAMFISWIAWKAGALDIIPEHAWTPSGADWFRDRGQWHDRPRRGDVVYFRWSKSRIHHVGIVEQVESGSIVTIEGNTADAVRRRRRRTGIVGYGRPAYDRRPRRGGRGGSADVDWVNRKRGDEGNAVENIQALLNTAPLGRRIKQDGDYGPKTEAKVKRFQRWASIAVDGVVGPQTYRHLLYSNIEGDQVPGHYG